LRSIETKLIPIFHNSFKLSEDFIDTHQQWSTEILNGIVDYDSFPQKEIDKDKRINKVRGSLFAYFGGLSKESDGDLMKIKRYSKEILNITSTILNELSSTISETSEKKNKHKTPSEIVSRRFSQVESIVIEISQLLKSFEGENLEKAIEQYWGDNKAIEFIMDSKERRVFSKSVYEIIANEFKSAKWDAKPIGEEIKLFLNDLRHLIKYQNSRDYYDFKERIYALLAHIEKKINDYSFDTKKGNDLKNQSEIIYDFNKEFERFEAAPSNLSEFEKDIFNSIINTLIYKLDIANTEDFSSKREEVITEVAKTLKVQVQDFEGSDDYTYLQYLFKSLKTIGTGFKITESKSIPIMGFAYAVSRPNDFDKFHEFMEKNSFSRFGVAYAIIGAALGLANLPKTFFVDLFNNSNEGFNQLLIDFDIIYLGLGSSNKSPVSAVSEPELIITLTPSTFQEQVLILPQIMENQAFQNWVIKCFQSITQMPEISGFDESEEIKLNKELNKKGKPKGFTSDIIEAVVKVYRNTHE
jgi:hypothetical protein